MKGASAIDCDRCLWMREISKDGIIEETEIVSENQEA
jgi:hypothetical protein